MNGFVKGFLMAAVAATACMACTVRAATLPAAVDGVVTIDITEDTVYDSAIPSGVTNLVKTGAGMATLAAGNDGFTGTIEIKAGTLAGCVRETTAGTGYSYVRSFGDPARITITPGATLLSLDNGNTEVTATSGSHFLRGPLYVGGKGVDDLGAVRFTGVNADVSIHYLWKDVTLTSDTTLDASRRWGFGGGTFDMGGHDLTIIGGNIFELGRNDKTVCSNPGNIYVRDNASLLWESISSFTMPSGYKVGDLKCYLSDGGCVRNFLTTWASAKFPWGVEATGSGMLRGYSNSTTWDWELNHHWALDYYGYFHTPVILKDAATTLTTDYYTCDKSDTVNLGGGITGPGRLVVGNDKGRRGQTVLRGKSSSEIGSLKVYAGSLILTDGSTLSVTNQPKCNQWNEPTGVDSSESPVLIEGSNSNDSTPRLLVEKGCTFKTYFAVSAEDSTTASKSDAAVLIGMNGKTYGILDIRDGATVTNVLYMGYSGQGAVFMRGGDVFLKTMRQGNIGIGNYGAFVMDGGRLTTNSKLEIGTEGRGIFIQRGGVIDHATSANLSSAFSGQFSLARTNAKSYGCYYNCGGQLLAPRSQVWLMKHNSLINGYGTEAFFTLDGPDARAEIRQLKSMVQTNSVKYGAVVLKNGGELSCDRMFRDNFITECGANSVGNWSDIRNCAFTSRFHLVFDGGVLKTTKAGEFFSFEKLDGSAAEGVDATRAPERVLVYGKGATIDTAGNDVVFRAPLSAPEGKSLASVTLPDGTLTNQNYFVGPRRILVTDASDNLLVSGAVMDFNVTNRQQRGVIVTHPGENLPDGVKVRVENYTNDGWTDLTVANGGVTLCTPESGGLVKRGAGTLTLTGANTYGGTTRIEGGALVFLADGGFPGGDLEFAASAITNGASPRVTAPRMTFGSGSKLRITGADGLVAECVRGTKTLVSVTEPLSALPTVEWTDADGEPVALEGSWRVRLGKAGKSIDFTYSRGSVIIMR